MVEAVERIPVVANGDVRTIADAAVMFDETGCAAISIGRGALANPFFFRQLDQWAQTGEPGPDPGFEERLDLMSRHFHGLVDRRGEFYACLQFRKILKWYYHFTRMPKPFYLRLIKLSSAALFDETVAAVPRRRPLQQTSRPLRSPRAGADGTDRQMVSGRIRRGKFTSFSRCRGHRRRTFRHTWIAKLDCDKRERSGLSGRPHSVADRDRLAPLDHP